MEEVWRKIPGFQGFYEVSTLGRVRSWRKKGHVKGKRGCAVILRGGVSPKGYPTVRLTRKEDARLYYVHRLVAEVFLGPCPRGKQVNHRSPTGDKKDNRAENLEYVTPAENIAHARSVLGWGRSKLDARTVREIRVQKAVGVTATVLAAQYKVTESAIYAVVRRHTWKWVV